MIQRCALLPIIALPTTSVAGDLVSQAATVCVEQNATPTYIPDAENPAYSADAAISFIATHMDEVERKCAG